VDQFQVFAEKRMVDRPPPAAGDLAPQKLPSQGHRLFRDRALLNHQVLEAGLPRGTLCTGLSERFVADPHPV